MTDSTTLDPRKPPAPWVNRAMKGMLRTPLLQRLVGRSVAIVDFSGRRSGKAYSIPVSYARDGGTVTMLTWAERRWWHNFEGGAPVTLRLAGKRYSGIATVDRAADADGIRTFLTGRPVDAKAYGVPLDASGVPDEAALRSLVPRLVVIRVDLS